MLSSFYAQFTSFIRRILICSWAGHDFITRRQAELLQMPKKDTVCTTCGKWNPYL